ncbi:NAD(P)H dehydrogenase [Streptomyces antioxidans]|uniref:NAD(P)H dehydrogenase n=1 Tax=Streptomyces antioxidans TaxID=1507734 RepID=A0A1V4DBW7_9ACTN|nr:flavodoxin family protein [Streptomyces antioxidans]OPF83714.1 NAD(P)H dehydrogenase [Streptomyces antioxidans]
MKILAVSSSPRKDSNSGLLAQAVLDGAASRGHSTELVHLTDTVTAPLRDCRSCRQDDGTCSIEDNYEQLVLQKVLSADAIVFATPLYWYGMSGQLKIFIDRLFCYIKSDYPDCESVREQLVGKRMVVTISSEESYPGAVSSIVAQMQEFARYLHSDLVGVVRGIGNTRGEVEHDPSRPLDQAHDLGTRLFEERYTDYRIDTPRSGVVWPVPLG